MKKILSKVAVIWIPMVFFVLTFYVDDAYFNMLEAKAFMFQIMAFLYLIAILLLERGNERNHESNARNVGKKQEDISKQNALTKSQNNWNLLDVSVISFVGTAILSTILSEHKSDAFLGTYGWSVGGLHILTLGCLYFLISRYMKWEKWMYPLILSSIAVVCLWTSLDVCYIDLFGMHNGIVQEEAYNYVASIGNINWFAGYWALTFPFVLFGMRKQNLRRNILVGLTLSVMIFAGVNCRADSLFIALGVTLGLSLLRAIGKKEYSFYAGISWIIVGVSVGFGKLLRSYIDMVEPDGVCKMFMESHLWLIILLVGIGLLFMPDLKCKKYLQCGILVIGVIVVAVVIINQIKGFDASWGTGRGKTWMVAIEAFRQGNFAEKIIGIGPDCFGYAYEALTGSNWFRNAHNEYLQYLITMGIGGAISYIAIYIGSFWQLLKIDKNNRCNNWDKGKKKDGRPEKEISGEFPVAFACFAGIVAYAAQALVNNPQSLNGAILITLLAILRGVDYTKYDRVM